MLGWVHQPAGTQSGSPGRAVGGPRRLGCRVNVKYSRTEERGTGKLWGKGGTQGLWTNWLGSGGVLGMFVDLAWLKARVQSGELFKSVSKELCELGLELSQLERVQARLRLARLPIA